ncbi:MAG: hypothetical protein F4X44_10725 [Gammaproteobacteria bacterium]|nr:hypothetical protein [Gammaproteobacteria bacterium]MYD81071.1 hypothetical protein [Gammaproteobacteria bacterium]
MQKLKFLVALVALFVSATAFAKIAGTYVLEMEGGQGRGGESTLTFAVDDEGTYSATMASDWGENKGTDVKVDGNEFSFSVTMETQRGDFTLSYSGTVEDGELSGTMSSEGFEMSFTGKLKEEEEEEEGEDADDSAEDEPEA